MKKQALRIMDACLLTLDDFKDERGSLCEIYQQQRYQQLGLPKFVQQNLLHSKQFVLRGLHYQTQHSQAKLITVLAGKAFEVVVDLRTGSKTYGQHQTLTLDASHQQLYIPAGCAHGVLALTDETHIMYQCSDYYQPQFEAGLRYDDPLLGIEWPCDKPILSAKDQKWPHCHNKLPTISVEQSVC